MVPTIAGLAIETKLLLTSGLLQLFLGVMLGWPVALFHTGMKTVGPFRHSKRLLQCHIDNLMMGTIQLALFLFAADNFVFAIWLIILGSWMNAQLFMIQACLSSSAPTNWLKNLSITSFAVITVGYLVFVPTGLMNLWGIRP